MQLQKVIFFLATRSIDLVRKMKTREEDLPSGMSQSLTRLHRGSRDLASQSQSVSRPPRKDVESFLELTALVYRGRENAGLDLLDPRRRSFLKIVYDDRLSLSAKRVYFEMLASLSCGDKSAQSVYEILGGFASSLSWEWITGGLDWYATELNQSVDRGIAPDIMPDDLSLIRALLHVIRSVARYSPTARITLVEALDIVRRLFRLLSTRSPKELKAPIFDTLAVFCLADGITGCNTNILWTVWSLLEATQVVPASLQGGIIYDLEMIESKDETYPETLAFLRLMNTLLYPITENAEKHALSIYDFSSTDACTRTNMLAVPESYLLRGDQGESSVALRYATYVVQEVLFKSSSRGYCYPAERWKILHQCYLVIERWLFNFDLSGVDAFKSMLSSTVIDKAMDTTGSAPMENETFENLCQAYISHPGFHFLSSILSGGQLLQQMTALLSETVEHMDKEANKIASVGYVIRSVLRITLRVMDLQDAFICTLIPTLRHSSESVIKSMVMSLHLTSIYEHFLRTPRVLTNLVDYINSNLFEELGFIAVKVLMKFTRSSITMASETSRDMILAIPSSSTGKSMRHRLVYLFSESLEMTRIMAGFVNRLQMEDPEMAELDSAQLHGEPSVTSFSNAIRQAIADLFLSSITLHSEPPSIAHLLLGYEVQQGIRNTVFRHPRDSAVDAQKTCFYVLLELLQDNAGRSLFGPVDANSEWWRLPFTDLPLSLRHPDFHVKLVQIIYRLCENPVTSTPTMRYLRYGEDFFYRQLVGLSQDIVGYNQWLDGTLAGMPGQMRFGSIVMNQLHLRAWILKLAHLEIHVSAVHQEKRHGRRLICVLFNIPFDADGAASVTDDASMMKKLLDSTCLVHNQSSAWEEFSQQLKLLRAASVSATKNIDENGCELYDIRMLHLLLTLHVKEMEANGLLRTPQAHEESIVEMEKILSWALRQNLCSNILFARSCCIEAWSHVLQVCLNHYYEDIPVEWREEVLFESADVILHYLPGDLHASDYEALTEGLLVIFAKFRKDRALLDLARCAPESTYIPAGESGWESLPIEKLLGFFESLTQCIINKNLTPVARGNLFAVMLNYLEYVSSSSQREDLDRNSQKQRRLSKLSSGIVNIFEKYSDQLLDVICSSASTDEGGVWRTVSLAILNRLFDIGYGTSSTKSKVLLDYLSRRNFLRHFVEEIRVSDGPKLEFILSGESTGLLSKLLFLV